MLPKATQAIIVIAAMATKLYINEFTSFFLYLQMCLRKASGDCRLGLES